MATRKRKSSHLDGLSKAELKSHVAGVEATGEAMTLPLPGPLGAAFAGTGRTVCGVLVRAPVAIDFVILQKLESPLLKQMGEAAKPKLLRKETAFTSQDGWNMVYQFTTDPEVIEAEVNESKSKFERSAKKKVGMQMNPFAVNRIVEIIGLQISESFLTALRYMDSSGGDPGKDFPAPPAEPATASAGG